MDQPEMSRIASRVWSTRRRVWVEVVSWFWVMVAFIGIEASVAQARMIPSSSMEPTVLVGDHLLVSRVGYDVGIPFTSIREPLWREPKRQQIIVFQAPLADQGFPDFIKRCIGVPGDRVKIIAGTVYVNGRALREPYVRHSPGYQDLRRENFPADAAAMAPYFIDRPEWAGELAENTVNGELVVPPDEYFMMGDNRDDSNDSRYWGFTSRASIIGTPVMIYMSITAPEGSWDSVPGRLGDYAEALIHPDDIRWRRIFHLF
jgi:signal peptidase I